VTLELNPLSRAAALALSLFVCCFEIG
jgi:hypothetical protein